ncbi:MAG: hypothetical protein HY234_13060 [Acidobacteria bacterium]|nr:hypothetical protein [Acidobacteriota bacterium]
MKAKNILKLRIERESTQNAFCPRCGLVVPPYTRFIPSPTRPEEHYHAKCLLALAEQLGSHIQWVDC